MTAAERERQQAARDDYDERIDALMRELAAVAAARNAAEAHAAKLREALAAVLTWGVEQDDPRIGYLTVQVDRVAEREAREALAAMARP